MLRTIELARLTIILDSLTQVDRKELSEEEAELLTRAGILLAELEGLMIRKKTS